MCRCYTAKATRACSWHRHGTHKLTRVFICTLTRSYEGTKHDTPKSHNISTLTFRDPAQNSSTGAPTRATRRAYLASSADFKCSPTLVDKDTATTSAEQRQTRPACNSITAVTVHVWTVNYLHLHYTCTPAQYRGGRRREECSLEGGYPPSPMEAAAWSIDVGGRGGGLGLADWGCNAC